MAASSDSFGSDAFSSNSSGTSDPTADSAAWESSCWTERMPAPTSGLSDSMNARTSSDNWTLAPSAPASIPESSISAGIGVPL